jgi:hypothetical protein
VALRIHDPILGDALFQIRPTFGRQVVARGGRRQHLHGDRQAREFSWLTKAGTTDTRHNKQIGLQFTPRRKGDGTRGEEDFETIR